MTKLSKLNAALMIAGVLAVGGSARADDAKIYFASSCRASQGAVTVGASGELINNSAASATVQCPIVRDETVQSLEYIGVLIRDMNPLFGTTTNFSCYVRRRTTAGFVGTSRAYGTPNDGFTGASSLPEEIQMFLDSSGTSSFDPGNGAAIMLECTIPGTTSAGASVLYLYRVEENN